VKDIRKILFISLSNLGDIVLTTPVFERLRDNFPEAVIDVITGPSGAYIFSASPAAGKITVRRRRQTARERISELRRIRQERYDLVVDLKRSLIPVFSGARYKAPCFLAGRGRGHMKDVHLSVIRSFGLDAGDGPRFFFPVTPEDRNFVSGILGSVKTSGKIVVINPGAKSHIKRWGISGYAELVTALEGELGCGVFIVGAEEDKDTARSILTFSKSNAVDLSGKTSLGALYEMIKRSDLFITNDSGPLHMASAAGTPTVAIFGPSSEKKYGPLASSSVVLAPDVDCRPCEKALCSKGFKNGCISGVMPCRVFEAAKSLLEKSAAHKGADR
jgi:ADP-heptose:LPS heptosyltransferase